MNVFAHFFSHESSQPIPDLLPVIERAINGVEPLLKQVGYDRAAEIAKHAHRDGGTPNQAALALGYVAAEGFDRWVIPAEMVHP